MPSRARSENVWIRAAPADVAAHPFADFASLSAWLSSSSTTAERIAEELRTALPIIMIQNPLWYFRIWC
ncbi:MAG: hypothetical protein JO066_07480 [Verrucomicrobia bacterium]|nr:hypothetical protein [Verrucomicrobiota bacterium]